MHWRQQQRQQAALPHSCLPGKQGPLVQRACQSCTVPCGSRASCQQCFSCASNAVQLCACGESGLGVQYTMSRRHLAVIVTKCSKSHSVTQGLRSVSDSWHISRDSATAGTTARRWLSMACLSSVAGTTLATNMLPVQAGLQLQVACSNQLCLPG